MDIQNEIVVKVRELTHRGEAIKLFGYMVVVAQLVRASDCGSEGRGFEPRLPPFRTLGFLLEMQGFSFSNAVSGHYKFSVQLT